jgi:hypothetical protein
MSKRFRECNLDQMLLLPASLHDWLPEGHLARFVAELVETLDLSAIYGKYEEGDGRGLAAYDPRMMVRVEARVKEREQQAAERGRKLGGRPPEAPDPEQAKPEPKAQRNFTDPDSRIMKDGATKEFVQAYNAQAAVDSEAQVIVAAEVTQEANDKQQLVPMLEQVKIVTGSQPQQVTADSGYFSEAQVTDRRLEGIDLWVAPDRQKHGEQVPVATGPPVESPPALSPTLSPAQAMRHKLQTLPGQAIYKMRKAVVEPVFGQIKEQRGFRKFLLRGLLNVQAEWKLICATHNPLKLYRSGRSSQMA